MQASLPTATSVLLPSPHTMQCSVNMQSGESEWTLQSTLACFKAGSAPALNIQVHLHTECTCIQQPPLLLRPIPRVLSLACPGSAGPRHMQPFYATKAVRIMPYGSCSHLARALTTAGIDR